jgi:hypothetical protein
MLRTLNRRELIDEGGDLFTGAVQQLVERSISGNNPSRTGERKHGHGQRGTKKLCGLSGELHQ